MTSLRGYTVSPDNSLEGGAAQTTQPGAIEQAIQELEEIREMVQNANPHDVVTRLFGNMSPPNSKTPTTVAGERVKSGGAVNELMCMIATLREEVCLLASNVYELRQRL